VSGSVARGSIALAEVLQAASRWLAQDPDPQTRAELEDLIGRAAAADGDEAAAELVRRFDGRLQFGTAGLRGPLEAGPNGMNRVLVAQTAAGLARHLLGEGSDQSIVIGYDARTNSHVFAEDIAQIMAGHGIRTTLLPSALPTPVLATAVRRLDASAGVMVTASHNPAQDNGVKVFLGGADGGSQIVRPDDERIAAAIAQAADEDISTYARASTFRIAGDDVVDFYVDATARRGVPGAEPLRFVYTPLHGVGGRTARRVFVAAGFGDPISVPAQEHPDASFPTVPFPNPEEEGALDLAIELARSEGADLVIAHDPDADRLAVAIPARGGWRRLTGNEIGLLLGWRAAARADRRGGSLVASLVSSPGLAEVARIHELPAVETLTGFKYISRVPDLLFGFEEALGYLVDPDKVRDKDGISAAVEFLSLAAEARDRGVGIEEYLEELAERIGGHASAQVSIRVESTAGIRAIMHRLRSVPPTALAAEPVQKVSDFENGHDGFAPSDLLRFTLSGGARVIIRPSGTEPKLKAYIDVRDDRGTGAERLAHARARVAEIADDVRILLLEGRE